MLTGAVAVPTLTLLSPDQCEQIHLASLEILRRTGVRVFHRGALDLLEQNDAIITDGNLVRFPAGLVEWSLAQVPSRVPLGDRRGGRVTVPLEGRQVSFGTGSDCPNYLDPRTGERRPFTARDLVDAIRVVDALPEMGFCMSMGIPVSLSAPNGTRSDGVVSAYRLQFSLMLRHTAKPIVFVCDDREDCEAIVAMATVAAGSQEEADLSPSILLYSEPSSPLRHSETATDKLLFMAEQALPIVHSPAPMMGGTAPVTVPAGLALGNAEILSSLVMHQLKRPGAPFVYGSGLHHLDMKTTISVYGAPEFQLARLAIAEMGRYYSLPTWGYAGHSDSCVMDQQAAADAAFSVLVALLAGSNLVHDVGYLEAGLTTSPEMIVFTAEMISMMSHFAAGFTVDIESLALDVIHRVGPGGDFLTDQHTMEHFRELWQPTILDRRRAEDWVVAGSLRLGDRLRDRTVAIIEKHRPDPLPGSVLDEIDYILRS